METLLSRCPDLLDQKDKRDLSNAEFCKRHLGLKISNRELLRRVAERDTVSGYRRYWKDPFGDYYVCSQWGKQNHKHNAEKLLEFLKHLIKRKATHRNVQELEEHRQDFETYLRSNRRTPPAAEPARATPPPHGEQGTVKRMFGWVDFFTELADRIDKAGPQELNEHAKRIDWHLPRRSESERRQADVPLFGLDDIDPLTFFSYLATRTREPEGLQEALANVRETFGVDQPVERCNDWDVLNVYNLLVAWARLADDRELLWSLFRQTVAGQIEADTFESALRLQHVAIPTLSCIIFLIKPRSYLHLPGVPAYQKPYGVGTIPPQMTWNEYSATIERIKADYPGCEFFEIELFHRLQRGFGEPPPLVVDPDRCWVVSTNKNTGTDDLTTEFHQDYCVRLDELSVRGGEQRQRPLAEPEPGHLILLRFGHRGSVRGRGIGVVYRNDYEDGWAPERGVHVLWLNKRAGSLKTEGRKWHLFEEAGAGIKSAFRECPEYARTWEALDRMAAGSDGTGDPDAADDPAPTRVDYPRNQILYGPPGTGKTYQTVSHALAVVRGVDVDTIHEDRKESPEAVLERYSTLRFKSPASTGGHLQGQVTMVTFHQNYAYEDFVEGIRPKLVDAGSNDGDSDAVTSGSTELAYELRPGIFRSMCEIADSERKKARDDGDEPPRYVLVIDEINRGNIPKIFGELITLIEPSRRLGANDETTVTLPYSSDDFGVPDNLYIIGTMNTADRSIQQMDTALRRRFTFVEMMPDPNHELISEDVDGVNCRKMLRAMNERIAVLLDREHQIGHTYLLNVETLKQLADTFRNRVFPLLQEYFYDDWRKIRAVLGNNAFVREGPSDDGYRTDLAEDFGLDGARDRVYDRVPLDDESWKDAEQYKQIYADSRKG